MPAPIKCTKCGHRILRTSVVRICSNCGAFLPFEEIASESTDVEHLPALPPEVIHLPPSIDRIKVNEDKALTPYTTIAPATTTTPTSKKKSSAFPSPYEKDETEFSPIVIQQMAPRYTQQANIGDLPQGYPRRPANITGTLVHVQSQMEHQTQNDTFGGIFRGISDMISPMPVVNNTQREREQIQTTSLRVRLNDGDYRDARIHGYLTSASLAIGDVVSLWGHQRHGTLIVGRGYNHTSKSKIIARTTASSFAFLIILAIFAIIIYIIAISGHIPLLPLTH